MSSSMSMRTHSLRHWQLATAGGLNVPTLGPHNPLYRIDDSQAHATCTTIVSVANAKIWAIFSTLLGSVVVATFVAPIFIERTPPVENPMGFPSQINLVPIPPTLPPTVQVKPPPKQTPKEKVQPKPQKPPLQPSPSPSRQTLTGNEVSMEDNQQPTSPLTVERGAKPNKVREETYSVSPDSTVTVKKDDKQSAESKLYTENKSPPPALVSQGVKKINQESSYAVSGNGTGTSGGGRQLPVDPGNRKLGPMVMANLQTSANNYIRKVERSTLECKGVLVTLRNIDKTFSNFDYDPKESINPTDLQKCLNQESFK